MSTEDPQARSTSSATWLLGLGALLGLVLAAGGLLRGEAETAQLPGDVIARVNGTALRSDDFERLVNAVLEDMRTPDAAKARQRVLARMIEEELLIQRALELGLAHLDRKVRADLATAMITSVVDDTRELEPSDAELRDFYQENRDYFTRPGRLFARQIFFRVARNGKPTHEKGSASERAATAHERLLAGEPWEQVKQAYGDLEVSPIPATLLPANKLREYTGPTLLRAIGELETGAITAPVRSGMGIHIAQLVERGEPVVPGLDEIRAQVLVDWRRRQGDKALRAYLDELRDYAEIEIAEGYEDSAS